jgi:hypothetical protein
MGRRQISDAAQGVNSHRDKGEILSEVRKRPIRRGERMDREAGKRSKRRKIKKSENRKSENRKIKLKERKELVEKREEGYLHQTKLSKLAIGKNRIILQPVNDTLGLKKRS